MITIVLLLGLVRTIGGGVVTGDERGGHNEDVTAISSHHVTESQDTDLAHDNMELEDKQERGDYSQQVMIQDSQ